MEARLLASVLQTDTHKRLTAADEISDYLKKEENSLDEFAEMDRFVTGLAAWMGSSNFKVSVSAMEIMGILVEKLKTKFKPHLSTIFPPLKERLGDAKEQVREQGQQLIQQIFQNVVGSPQAFLDKLMESCLVHKNWRVKEQGLLCLSRTLSYFGSGQVTVSKFMAPICTLLGDANSQVRSCAMETIVDIYRHVGVKVRIDVSRRNIQQSHLAKLNAQFDAVDATTGNHKSDADDLLDDFDRESVSSAGSARTFGSTRSGRSSTAARGPSRPSSVARMATTSSTSSSGSGGVTEADFEKVFGDIPDISMFTQHDVEKRVSAIDAILSDKDAHWEKRVSALKELRSVAKSEVIDHTHFITVLRDVENSMVLSLKDLRSQITREACVTISYLSTILGSGFAHFAEAVIPQLIILLPNSAKIMASSADVCIKFIIKNTPTHRLLTHISYGMSSKSPVTRRECAVFVSLAASTWSTGVLERALSLLEDLLKKGLKDADAQTRKHMRRAFWGYHAHFPSNANRLLDSFDSQVVKYVNDEKALLDQEAGGTTSNVIRPNIPRKKHAPPLASQSETCLSGFERTESPSSPSKELFPPAIRLVRPTIRSPRKSKGDPSKMLRPASSMETLLDRKTDRPKSPSTSPIPRPPSRTGKVTGIRPPSRTGIPRMDKKPSSNELLPGKKVKMRSRSAQPSPTHSRESSPVRDEVQNFHSSTLPHRVAPLTAEVVKKLHGFGDIGGSHDDDDAESVTSECSTFSVSSEVSVSPYVRYPHPVTDLNELVGLCSSSQWSERRDGIGQLHMLLESSRPFSHSDMVKVKAVFKRMLAEPHAKVFGMFLDTLVKFIEERREQLDDWLFIMLLRLLHRQGTDMLSSVHFKLQLVLEHIRKSFEESTQFAVLCRILTDQTQPMNNKVKLGWLEYFLELLPLLDSVCLKESSEIRQALSKLLAMTMEPKSADIRRLSQKVIIGFFDLNPAALTLLLRNMSKTLQENANRILKGYMNDMSSSSGEESDKEVVPKKVRRRAGAATPTGMRTPSSQFRPKTPQGSGSRLGPMASLPPSGPRGLKGARTISSSTPAVNNMDAFLNRSSGKSRIPTPRSGIPRRPGSTTPGSTPSTSSSSSSGKVRRIPPRAQSVDPYKMATQSLSSSSMNSLRRAAAASSGGRSPASKIKRPSSSRSDYTPLRYQNGSDDSHGTPSSGGTLEHFSFSDLPNLDFGSPDEDEGMPDPTSPGEKDQMATVTRELQTASSAKNRQAVLQSLLTLAREYPERCNWEEHFKSVLLRLLDLMGDSDSTVKLYSLRVLREVMKTQHERLRDYAELTTLKVLKCFADQDPTVSQASEDVFTLLAPALPSESAVELLAPMVATEKHPMLLGTIKLFTKVISLADAEYLQTKLASIVPGIIRGYCHSESSVRKGSVFCLVALHSVVGDSIREHLTKLSSSQTKLLDLYIKRHQQEAASKTKT